MKAHVSDAKKKVVQEFSHLLEQYAIVGAVNMENLPTKQLQKMRADLRGTVVLRLTKRRLLKIAISGAKDKKSGLEEIIPHLKGMPALLFTNENPFTLYKKLQKSKSPAPAKAGQLAPSDIVVPAGPTSFAPGPVIGELGALGIKSGVEDGKIAIKEDCVVAKEGDEISAPLAAMLARLDINPMEIGLDLVAVWEKGTIFTKDVLHVDEDEFMAKLLGAHQGAFNLAIDMVYFTKDTVELLLSKAAQASRNLAMETNLLTSETTEDILAKAHSQMMGVAAESNFAVQEGTPAESTPEVAKEESAPEAPAEPIPEPTPEPQEEAKEEKPEEPEAPKDEPAPEAPAEPTPEAVIEKEEPTSETKEEVQEEKPKEPEAPKDEPAPEAPAEPASEPVIGKEEPTSETKEEVQEEKPEKPEAPKDEPAPEAPAEPASEPVIEKEEPAAEPTPEPKEEVEEEKPAEPEASKEEPAAEAPTDTAVEVAPPHDIVEKQEQPLVETPEAPTEPKPEPTPEPETPAEPPKEEPAEPLTNAPSEEDMKKGEEFYNQLHQQKIQNSVKMQSGGVTVRPDTSDQTMQKAERMLRQIQTGTLEQPEQPKIDLSAEEFINTLKEQDEEEQRKREAARVPTAHELMEAKKKRDQLGGN